MRARTWLITLAICGAFALGAVFVLRAPAQGNNVVLVVIDTLRQDHLAAYGYNRDTAPFLSGLARQGAVLDGLSPTSWTKPAVASLLTGLHPVRHQAFNRQDKLPGEAVTLAELLKGTGYRTLAASANGWISPLFGFDQGIDSFLLHENVRGEDLNREIFPHLERLEPPFFLYVHYIDPHAPYAPTVAWDGRPLPPGSRPVSVEEIDGTQFRRRPAELLARARDRYDGEIREADNALRALVGRLEREGLMEDTVLVVTADHGEELEEHGRMSHGQTLYEEVVRVPLIVYAPHAVRAGRRPGRVSLLDVLPTLASLLGMRSPDRLDGEDLADRLAAGDSMETPARSFLTHLDFVDGTGLALTRGQDKLVLGKNPYRKELFDLARDPAERRSLLGGREDAAHFPRLAEEVSKRYNEYARASLAPKFVDADQALMKNLAALGYINYRGSSGHSRGIPNRITPPGPTPGGRLGWEAGSRLESCIELSQPSAARHLLDGWYTPELSGRWTALRGTLALALPSAAPRFGVTLSGVNHRPAPVGLRVKVERRPVLETQVAVGPFDLTAKVQGAASKLPVLVEIESDSVFVPSLHGGNDWRELGLFVSSVCLEGSRSNPSKIPCA